MATAVQSNPVVILGGGAGQSQPLRDGLSHRWRVVESIAEAGSAPYGLVGLSDGANAALQHAVDNPEAVEVLVLVSPTAIRPAAGDPNGDSARIGSPPVRRQMSYPRSVRSGGPLRATGCRRNLPRAHPQLQRRLCLRRWP